MPTDVQAVTEAVQMAASFVESPWLLLIILAPVLGALTITLGRRRMASRTVAWVGVGAAGLAFVAAVGALVTHLGQQAGGEGYAGLLFRLWPFWQAAAVPGAKAGGAPFGIELSLLGDGLSLWFALVVTGVGFLIHVYSVGYMAGDAGFARYFAELNYFIFAMSLLVLSDGLVGMIIGWANVGLASYLLIGFWYHRADARAASTKAFLVTFAGELGIVLGTALLWRETGTVRFYELFERLGGLSEGALTVAGLLLLWGAAAKSAQLPLHVWLPDAMAGPTPVSALIHAATMVTAGVYLTARMYPVYAAAPAAGAAVAWVGGLSALFGALVACGQTDIKRVLAYSTMSQIGYMILGVGLQAEAAGVFHFYNQAFFKALLFLAAGLVIHHLGGEQDMLRMGGLGRALKLAYAAYAVGALAMVGVPPFSGFYSKEAIIEAAWERGAYGLWAMAAAGTGLTAFYSVRMLALIFAGPEGEAVRQQAAGAAGHASYAAQLPGEIGERAAQQAMSLPVAVLAVLATVAGWVWVPGRTGWAVEVLGPVFERFRGALEVDAAAEAAHAPALVAWMPLLLAAVGAFAAWYLYGPARGPAGCRRPAPARVAAAWGAGLYIDATLRRILVDPAVRAAAWVDRHVEASSIDGGVNGVAELAAHMSAILGRAQSGFMRRYVLMLLGAAAVLLIWVVVSV
ncbi:MAG: NADH-quinone oxidoreductase subunit L [Bacillota bacterium]